MKRSFRIARITALFSSLAFLSGCPPPPCAVTASALTHPIGIVSGPYTWAQVAFLNESCDPTPWTPHLTLLDPTETAVPDAKTTLKRDTLLETLTIETSFTPQLVGEYHFQLRLEPGIASFSGDLQVAVNRTAAPLLPFGPDGTSGCVDLDVTPDSALCGTGNQTVQELLPDGGFGVALPAQVWTAGHDALWTATVGQNLERHGYAGGLKVKPDALLDLVDAGLETPTVLIDTPTGVLLTFQDFPPANAVLQSDGGWQVTTLPFESGAQCALSADGTLISQGPTTLCHTTFSTGEDAGCAVQAVAVYTADQQGLWALVGSDLTLFSSPSTFGSLPIGTLPNLLLGSRSHYPTTPVLSGDFAAVPAIGDGSMVFEAYERPGFTVSGATQSVVWGLTGDGGVRVIQR